MNQHERAQAFAKTALALMAERNVAPLPDNFKLFYAYAAGDNPSISRIIGDMIAGKKPFSPTVMDELRERFFDNAHVEKAVEKLGSHMDSALTSVIDTLEAAGRDTVAYGKTLSAVSGELVGDQSPAGVQKMVEHLLGATRAMETRAKELESELQRSSHEVTELRAKLDDVRKESLTDPLTGIANRKSFDMQLSLAIEQSREASEPFTLLMCDIDRFKKFNDSWGHQTGDQVLRLVAGCLSDNVKGRDTAARYGGEEFAVILPQTNLTTGLRLANQIRSAVEGKKLVKKSTGEVLGTITISIGLAQFSSDDTAGNLVRRADECLYLAKNAGRNCVVAEDDPRARQSTAAA